MTRKIKFKEKMLPVTNLVLRDIRVQLDQRGTIIRVRIAEQGKETKKMLQEQRIGNEVENVEVDREVNTIIRERVATLRVNDLSEAEQEVVEQFLELVTEQGGRSLGYEPE